MLIGRRAPSSLVSDDGVCVCGPKAHDCVGFFSETERPGIWADLGNLTRERVDLASWLVHNVHTILMIASMLNRLAGQFPATTVMMWLDVLVWRL